MNPELDQLVTRKVVVLKESTPINVCARTLLERNVGCVVVSARDGQMLGLITDRDLVCRGLAFEAPPWTPISELMTPNLRYVEDSATLADVTEMMRRHGIRRLPVAHFTPSGKMKCAGIITLDDLISAEAVDVRDVSQVARIQLYRRARPENPRLPSDRRWHTLNRFFNILSDETGLNPQSVRDVSMYLLLAVVRRIVPHEASQLIAQLPKVIQDDLLDTDAGPDIAITADRILEDLDDAFSLREDSAHDVTRGFWRALRRFLRASGELEDVAAQLPSDLRDLFGTDTIDLGRETGQVA